MATLTFCGQQIGDAVLRYSIAAVRASDPRIDTVLLADRATQSSDGPNVFYELTVTVTKVANTPMNLQRWVASIGELLLRDGTVSISEDSDELTMEDAALRGRIEYQPGVTEAPMKALGMSLVFTSAKAPT